MAHAHEDEIRTRYAIGKQWWERHMRHTRQTIADETGHAKETIVKAADPDRPLPRGVTPEQARAWRIRLRWGARAEKRWRRDSIAAIKAAYGISTDTLTRILDSDPTPETPSLVAQFLQRGFNQQLRT